MTALIGSSLTISIGERYRDVVSERWPVIVPAQPDELLASWLHRLAYANGVAPRSFARVLGLNAGMWSALLDLRLPTDVANLLRARTDISPQQLSAMMLSHALPKQLLLPLRNTRRLKGSTWLQFCSRCLAEDAEPYFRRRWRLATRITCTRHGYRLRDRCPSCQNGIVVFDQTKLAPQHYCVGCGYDLRGASIVAVSPAAKLLDRCIDDILQLEAITGPQSSILVRRLLSMPSLADVYPTMILTSLSTSMRTRCVERLTRRDHPNGWLMEDDDDVAVGQRVIPSTSSLSTLIELLTTALGRKRGRKAATNRRGRPVELAALLEAYTRMMESPARRPSRETRSSVKRDRPRSG